MYIHTVQRRVTYGETDKMGYMYYGRYADYYEFGRVEAMRNLGIVYRELEETGIIMPVLDLKISYKKPAFYDDLLTINTIIPKLPGVKIYFEYQIFNEGGTLINEGNSLLLFYDNLKKRPVTTPENLMEKLVPFFTEPEHSVR